jgi:ribosomal protein S4E
MNRELLEKYTKLGVHLDKVITTDQPSVVIWSKSRKRIVSGGDALELIKDGDNFRLSYENNIMVSMSVRRELTNKDIEEINNSEGIICTDALYGREGWRFGFIPTDDPVPEKILHYE